MVVHLLSTTLRPTILSLFRNRGVQVGIGAGAAGLGFFGLSQGTKEAFGDFASPIILILIVGVVLMLILRRGR